MGLDSYLYVKQEHSAKTLKQILELAKTDTKLQEAIGEDMEVLEELAQEGYVDTSHQVAYWRKANQIHNFFIQECAGGEADCRLVYVCMEDLKELVRRCKKIIKTVQYKKDWVSNGILFGSNEQEIFYLDDGTKLPFSEIKKLVQAKDPRISITQEDDYQTISVWRNLEHTEKATCFIREGVSTRFEYFILDDVISNPEIAEELLPTVSGFFFGSTDYTKYYIQDLEDTIKQIEPLLKKKYPPYTSFTYEASW